MCSSICVVVGAHGLILETVDGGAHWMRRRSGTENDLHAVFCMGPRLCAAVGSQGLVLTSGDGGATWSREQSGVHTNLIAVACATNCVALDDQGTILRSSGSSPRAAPSAPKGTNSPVPATTSAQSAQTVRALEYYRIPSGTACPYDHCDIIGGSIVTNSGSVRFVRRPAPSGTSRVPTEH